MNVHVFDTPEQLATEAAGKIAETGAAAIGERGTFALALSGGSTPRATYEHLARANLDWAKVHVFWSDERCVPPANPESNYGMTRAALLDQVAIPAANIHRIPGELEPAAAAAAYRDEIDAHFGAGGIPRLDLVLLGLGEDGHTASLFPGTEAVKRGDELVVENFVPLLDQWRVTMTYPFINGARKVIFLVGGDHKAQVVKELIESKSSRLPASAVRPMSGNLVWLLDKAAASLLAN